MNIQGWDKLWASLNDEQKDAVLIKCRAFFVLFNRFIPFHNQDNSVSNIKGEENMKEIKIVSDRFCTYCDTPIEKRVVDDMETHVCMLCQRIERGYSGTEKSLVNELREYLRNPDKYYQIGPLLLIIKQHYSQPIPPTDEKRRKMWEHCNGLADHNGIPLGKTCPIYDSISAFIVGAKASISRKELNDCLRTYECDHPWDYYSIEDIDDLLREKGIAVADEERSNRKSQEIIPAFDPLGKQSFWSRKNR